MCPLCVGPLASFPGLPTVQLAVCKNGGEGLVVFYHVNDSVSTWVDGVGEGCPIEKTHFVHVFFVSNLERYVFQCANVRNSSACGRNCKVRPLTHSFDAFFQWGTPPSLGLPRRPSRNKIYRHSPSIFAYCKQSKLDSGKAWERGYLCSLCIIVSAN